MQQDRTGEGKKARKALSYTAYRISKKEISPQQLRGPPDRLKKNSFLFLHKLFLGQTEPALAPLVVEDCFQKVPFFEIGPEGIREI
jgi:hypothetical protein